MKTILTRVDNVQTKRINILFVAVGIISGLTGILLYIQRRKVSKEQAEIFELDKEIKTLTLAKLKSEKQ